MDIRQLKYFVTIAEEGNITRAAKRLHIAQPPLSRQLKQMEEELGILLFERNKKKSILLTPEGNIFLKRAKEIITKMEESILEVKELNESIGGTLSVGLTIYCAPLILRKLKKIQETIQQLTFNIWEGEPAKLCELLDKRQIEIAVTTDSDIFTSFPVHKKPLKPDPCVMVVSRNWKIEGKMDLREMATFPFIMLRTSHGKGMYDNIIEAFSKWNLQPNIICECHDSAMLLSLVNAGFGATILPLSMLTLSSLENLITIDIIDTPLIMEPIAVWRANSYLSKTASEFLKLF